jgi:hypothetical protein
MAQIDMHGSSHSLATADNLVLRFIQVDTAKFLIVRSATIDPYPLAFHYPPFARTLPSTFATSIPHHQHSSPPFSCRHFPASSPFTVSRIGPVG